MVIRNIILIFIFIFGFIFCQTQKEIKQAKEYIQKTGISIDNAKSIARTQGYSDNQINQVIESAKKEDLNKIKKENVNLIEAVENYDLPSNLEEIVKKKEEIKSDKKIKKLANGDQPFFGYTTFEGDPELFQGSLAGAVDLGYLIGPGDEIIIMLWGETQFRQVFKVDREGFIFIPEIGQVFVNGLNLSLLESKLYKVLSQSYASLDPKVEKPTTFLDISLGNLRPLRIQVMGEVAQPGAYVVSPSATLFSSLYYFNGPTTLGSLRDIHLIRNGEKVTSIDFYDYLLTGKKIKDQKLQLDDVIFIPRRLKTVTIKGEINRPGVYEIKPGESLTDLISLSGDLKITAYIGRLQIDRILSFQNRSLENMNRMFIDVDLDEVLRNKLEIPLYEGDIVQIFPISEIRENIIRIDGAVQRPGVYEFKDLIILSDLIKKAEGLTSDAYLDKYDLIRIKEDLTEQLVTLNLQKALEGDEKHNIALSNNDRVQIYKTSEMIDDNFVFLEGYAKKTGSFPLRDNMRIYDLLFKSGGFLDPEFLKIAYLSRADLIRMNEDKITRRIISFNLGNVLNSYSDNQNYELEADDIIKVYKNDIFISSDPVYVNGDFKEVKTIFLKDKMTHSDVIFELGGLIGGYDEYRVEIAQRDAAEKKTLHNYANLITFNIDNNYKIKNTDVISEENLNEDDEYLVRSNDVISIKANVLLKMYKEIEISGEILFPGKYTILSSKEKISDILFRAGGLLPSAYPEASEYYRNGLKINIDLKKAINNPNSKLNLEIQDKDKIFISEYPKIVLVKGEVNKSGINRYISNKSVKYYLKQSGGLKKTADIKSIWLEYPNGDSKQFKYRSLFPTKVIDGTIITVGKEAEKEPLDVTELLKEITSIVANLVQVLAVFVIAKQP